MFWRVAYVIAREDGKFGADEAEVEALAREFYALMTRAALRAELARR